MNDRTFRTLTFRQKLQYLWDYGKYYFLGITFLLFFIVYFIVPYISDLSYKTKFSIAIVDCNSSQQSNIDLLEKELISELGLNPSKETVRIDTSPVQQENESASVINLTIAMSGISQNDIVICDEKTYLKFQKQGAFVNLTDTFGILLPKYILYDDYSINLEKSVVWRALKLTDYSPARVCVLKESPHQDLVPDFINYLFSEK